MMQAIVGLVMTVEEIEGSFKLNQHKSDVDHAAHHRCAGFTSRRRRATARTHHARDAAAGLCQ